VPVATLDETLIRETRFKARQPEDSLANRDEALGAEESSYLASSEVARTYADELPTSLSYGHEQHGDPIVTEQLLLPV
jgi:hypothetical protein